MRASKEEKRRKAAVGVLSNSFKNRAVSFILAQQTGNLASGRVFLKGGLVSSTAIIILHSGDACEQEVLRHLPCLNLYGVSASPKVSDPSSLRVCHSAISIQSSGLATVNTSVKSESFTFQVEWWSTGWSDP